MAKTKTAKKTTRRKVSKKRATNRTSSTATPAVANKSKAIRDYAQSHPQAKPKEIAAALSEQGIEVSAAFVSTIKSNAKGKKKARRSGRKATNGEIAISDLLAAKKVADQFGGIERASAALDALAKLQ